jgi:hypothetical protein
MSKLFSFLKSAEVEEVKVVATTGAKRGGPRKQWNPAPALLAIRIWQDGSVFPSQALVDKFDLEYKDAVITFEDIAAKPAVMEADGLTIKTEAKEAHRKRIATVNPPVGNGFDVIDTREWGQWKMPENNMLFIGAVPKDLPKVDLFSSTVYNDEGKASNTVMEQGAATFGKGLVTTIKEIYGIELSDDKEYVDMIVATELDGVNINTQFSKPITLAPKKVSRGKDAGQMDYVRRENMILYGFVPAEQAGLIAGTDAIEETAQAIEQHSEVAQEA